MQAILPREGSPRIHGGGEAGAHDVAGARRAASTRRQAAARRVVLAVAARAWAVAVATATGLPVTLRDERLSSHVAESRVGPAKRGPSGGPPGPARRAANRARIDREAARVILEDELRRYGEVIERLSERSQLIVVTHNRETMSHAGVLYGVTMQGDGISRLIGLKLDDAEKMTK